jgi:polar amino acid transport system permease protein
MGMRSIAALLAGSLALLLLLSRLEPFQSFLPILAAGTWTTIGIALASAVLSVTFGFVAALARLFGPWPLRWLSRAYIEVFRGTSALVQLFWLFFVLPHFGVMLEPFTVAVLTLSLNVGAYGAEVVRGAIQAIPKGQWEASIALNMSSAQTLRRIIVPQAIRAMIPPWGNLFIELIKATALVSLITISDLAFKAQQLNQVTMQTTAVFTLVLLVYLIIALAVTLGMRLLERKAGRGILVARAS